MCQQASGVGLGAGFKVLVGMACGVFISVTAVGVKYREGIGLTCGATGVPGSASPLTFLPGKQPALASTKLIKPKNIEIGDLKAVKCLYFSGMSSMTVS